jgi:hypothetical protein
MLRNLNIPLRQSRIPGAKKSEKLLGPPGSRNKIENPPGNHPISAGILLFLDLWCSGNANEKKKMILFFREKIPFFILISRTHKRTEGRAPVWGSEFTSKGVELQG